MDPEAVEIPVASRAGVEEVRRAARAMASALGFAQEEAEMVVLAAIELATNLHRYAREGRIRFTPLAGAPGVGIEVTSRDAGPGIPDRGAALRDGFSTGGGRGNGLPAVRRLMDEFSVVSGTDGTTIVARKWRSTP
ncbi:MAG TPA: ATP-binding protein [Nitrolancea sp.]|jgi:serine/threonine-protein kinase RsbT|nr:ATP-binding protein [Nitrolancea sp.]